MLVAKEKREGKLFYGWVIVVGMLLLMMANMGIIYNCYSLMLKTICAETGYSRQQVSFVQTIISAANMLFALFSGRIYRHINPLRLMKIASFAMIGGYIAFSFCEHLLAMYAMAILFSAGYSACCQVPISMIVSNWFIKKRGMAVGIAMGGSGLTAVFLSPLINAWLQQLGWQMTMRILGGIMGVITLPVIFGLLRYQPADMGLAPYGAEELAEEPASALQEQGPLFREVYKTPLFIMLALCAFANTLNANALAQLPQPYLTDIGYSNEATAIFVSIYMGALAVGKFLLGALFDRLGVRRATFVANGCLFLGLLGMVFAKIPAFLPLIVLGIALGSSFGTVGQPLIVRGVYGGRDYATIYGFMLACNNLAVMFSPQVNAFVFDTCGSYQPILVVWLVLSLVVTVLYSLTLKRVSGPAVQGKTES